MKTEIITISDENDLNSIQKAAHLLEQGALIAFPTETVYGIGCRVEPKAIHRLDQVKGRTSNKRYTLHLGSPDQISNYVPHLSLRAQKLINKALPGPVTIVFELDETGLGQIRESLDKEVAKILYQDNTIGIRCPDHPVAAAILSAARCPVVAPSANPANKVPAVTFQQASNYFEGLLAGIVKSSNYKNYQKSSTVVKIGKKHIRILRQGAISAEQIREFTTFRILFVCTGNTCRSPMAEAVCKKVFCDILGCSVDELTHFGYIVESAGVAALPGIPASEHTVQVCNRHDIPLPEHQSAALTPQQIDESDRIFVMSRNHLQAIVDFNPEAVEKCFLLDEKRDIADPIGLGLQTYERCYEQIEKAVRQRVSEIL